mmetsp:Transcript_24636/g.85700  ORF Transcript_24636/g.85700 Transcript_24636/m.85700 type:complete len:315 (-) Transcript_24636:99-1043(-)
MTTHQEMAAGPSWFHPVKDFVAGTIGGFAGKIFEYPFDSVKVMMQTSETATPSALSVFRDTIRAEGARGLYRGMAVPLAGTMLETSCLFTANGAVKQLLKYDASVPEEKLPMRHVLLAGGVSGLAVSFILTPIELVKCRLQVQTAALEAAAAGTAPPPRLTFTGPVDCFTKSVAAEGLRVMYRGHAATVLREVPGTACWFGAYEAFARAMTPRGGRRENLPASTIIMAGALGGMAYWGVFYPADTVKSIMQTGGPGSTLAGTFRRVYRAEGVRGLYRGIGPTLLRAAPANAAIFLFYELTARMLNATVGDWLVE